MHMCIYIYVYTYKNAYYTKKNAYVCFLLSCTQILRYTLSYIHMYVCVCVYHIYTYDEYTCLYVCVGVCVCKCNNVYRCIHTYVYIHTRYFYLSEIRKHLLAYMPYGRGPGNLCLKTIRY